MLCRRPCLRGFSQLPITTHLLNRRNGFLMPSFLFLQSLRFSGASLSVHESTSHGDSVLDYEITSNTPLSSPASKKLAIKLSPRRPKFEKIERLRLYSSLLHDCASKGSLVGGRAIHGHIVRNGVEPDSHLWISLLNFYSKCGSLLSARKVFDNMTQIQFNRKKHAIKLSPRRLKFKKRERLRLYSSLLHDCASKGSLVGGRAIHGHIVRNGIDPDSHLWISLLNLYSKCGSLPSARKVFDSMSQKDVVPWTVLVTGFVAEGYASEGIGIFCEMVCGGIRPNEYTLATSLRACSMCLNSDFGKQLHAMVAKVGFFSDLFVSSSLVDVYAKCGELKVAESVFSSMPSKNAVVWNTLVNGYAQVGDVKEVFRLFSTMNELEEKFSKYTLSAVLKGCANSGRLIEGRMIHSLMIKIMLEMDDFLGCSLIDVYSKCGRVVDALKVFWTIKDPDLVSWTAVITCLYQQGHREEMVHIIKVMMNRGIRPNQVCLTSLLGAATNFCHFHHGTVVHAFVCKFGYESDIAVSNALITFYMKNGCLQDGLQVFGAIESKDSVSWNAVLCGLHDCSIPDLGPKVFHQMITEDFRPDICALTSVLRFCADLEDVEYGKQVHTLVVKNGLNSNEIVGTTLIDMYSKNKCLEDAEVAFRTLINRDVLSWTAIITCYLRCGQVENSLKHFVLMQREGGKPNEFTLASCLSGCSHIGTLESGRLLHSLSIKAGHFFDCFVASAVIDMYLKCGCMDDAEVVFKLLVSRDTTLWNTMICGYSQHSQAKKALEAFHMMMDEGVTPDAVTFVGVLSACSNMGLVDEGKDHFNSISATFGIRTTLEHCACMVSMLVRAGRFSEMENFINVFELSPHALIWETVLGACQVHGYMDLGRRAAEKLFELQPDNASNYIMLSNIYASWRCWEDVQKVRELMCSSGLKKERACSWVEVDGTVHVFMSQDFSHPNIQDVYLKLEELGEKLASTGYTPKPENVLHNVSDKERKEYLYHHSERLALAFALIRIDSKKKIRIFKNNRICKDCHDVMKIVSDIADRRIVVRDIGRFHYFKNRACSCQDLW